MGESYLFADMAIAPMPMRKRWPEELSVQLAGMLISTRRCSPEGVAPHPYDSQTGDMSLLRRRMVLAYDELGGGDIYGQGILKIDCGVRLQEFCERDVIPSARVLKRCLKGLQLGIERLISRVHAERISSGA